MAKCYFYYGRAYEQQNAAGSVRPVLYNALRAATLRNDSATQATLINELLRGLVNDKLYAQAELLASKTVFPETAAYAEAARHHYYLGRIKAVQLDYSEANNYLQSVR